MRYRTIADEEAVWDSIATVWCEECQDYVKAVELPDPDVCRQCGHLWSHHAFIPDPPKPGTVYVGCRCVSYGINPDDDLQCGCRAQKP